jgi:hypothetical protein
MKPPGDNLNVKGGENVNLSGLGRRPERVPKAAGVQGPGRLDMSGSLAPASKPIGVLFKGDVAARDAGRNRPPMRQGGSLSYKSFRPAKSVSSLFFA